MRNRLKYIFSKQSILLNKSASGTKTNIIVFEYKHPKAKKTIYLQGGLHGIELSGIPVILEFMKEIETLQLEDHYLCIPFSNPMGIDSQIMGIQVGYNNLHTNAQNCLNWNRICQLRYDGSIEGNWIHQLLNYAETADIVLDLHTAGAEAIPHIYCHTSQIEFAKGLGIPHILSWDQPSNSFSDTCFNIGKVALTFELSSSRSVNRSVIKNGVAYLKRFFNLIPKEQTSEIWDVSKQLKKLLVPEPGILCWNKNCGDFLTKNEEYATLYQNEKKMNLKSPMDGIILIKYPIHAPHQNQEIAKILTPLTVPLNNGNRSPTPNDVQKNKLD